MSDSVWPADTNRRIPTGSLHLSKFDFFDVTMKTESSFNICWRKDINSKHMLVKGPAAGNILRDYLNLPAQQWFQEDLGHWLGNLSISSA